LAASPRRSWPQQQTSGQGRRSIVGAILFFSGLARGHWRPCIGGHTKFVVPTLVLAHMAANHTATVHEKLKRRSISHSHSIPPEETVSGKQAVGPPQQQLLTSEFLALDRDTLYMPPAENGALQPPGSVSREGSHRLRKEEALEILVRRSGAQLNRRRSEIERPGVAVQGQQPPNVHKGWMKDGIFG